MESIELVPQTASVRLARNFVSDVLASLGVRSWVPILLVSELASNVVRHARTPFTVGVAEEAGGIRLEVTDGAGAVRLARKLASDQGGMGLGIVEELSERWGVYENPEGGKTVWVTIDRSALEEQSA